MGDRANIGVIVGGAKSEGPIFLYSHWGGSEIKNTLALALDSAPGRGRWNDSSYLARIILDTMTRGADPETGFGISRTLEDNEYPVLIVDPDTKSVHEVDEATALALANGEMTPAQLREFSGEGFEDFIAKHVIFGEADKFGGANRFRVNS